jgi:hypothetical protein
MMNLRKTFCIGVALAMILASGLAHARKPGLIFGKIKNAYQAARHKAMGSMVKSGASPDAYRLHYSWHKAQGLRGLAKKAENPATKGRLSKLADRIESRLASQLTKPARRSSTQRPKSSLEVIVDGANAFWMGVFNARTANIRAASGTMDTAIRGADGVVRTGLRQGGVTLDRLITRGFQPLQEGNRPQK